MNARAEGGGGILYDGTNAALAAGAGGAEEEGFGACSRDMVVAFSPKWVGTCLDKGVYLEM